MIQKLKPCPFCGIECQGHDFDRPGLLTPEEAFKKGSAEIRAACSMCNGTGSVQGPSEMDHDCGGDDRLCAVRCPVETPGEIEQCEYCGRPIEALRRAFGLEESK